MRWALSAIGGTSEGSTAVILSIGLGLSVLASIGQIDGNLRQIEEHKNGNIDSDFNITDICLLFSTTGLIIFRFFNMNVGTEFPVPKGSNFFISL